MTVYIPGAEITGHAYAMSEAASFLTSIETPLQYLSKQSNTVGDSGLLYFKKSKASLGDVAATDVLGKIVFQGYYNSGFRNSHVIDVSTTGVGGSYVEATYTHTVYDGGVAKVAHTIDKLGKHVLGIPTSSAEYLALTTTQSNTHANGVIWELKNTSTDDATKAYIKCTSGNGANTVFLRSNYDTTASDSYCGIQWTHGAGSNFRFISDNYGGVVGTINESGSWSIGVVGANNYVVGKNAAGGSVGTLSNHSLIVRSSAGATYQQLGIIGDDTNSFSGIVSFDEGGNAQELRLYSGANLGITVGTTTACTLGNYSVGHKLKCDTVTLEKSAASIGGDADGTILKFATDLAGNPVRYASIRAHTHTYSNRVGLDFYSCNDDSQLLVGRFDDNGSWAFGPTTGGVDHVIWASMASSDNYVRVQSASALTDGHHNGLLVTSGDKWGTIIDAFKRSGSSAHCGRIMLQQESGISQALWCYNGKLYISATETNAGSGTGTVVGDQTSDERLKKIDEIYPYGLPEIMKLKPIAFEMNGERRIGFGAQTTRNVIPELVYSSGNVIKEGEELGLAMRNGNDISSIIVKGMQELQEQIEQLKKQLEK